nr:SAM-dependent methyltransferase [Actinomycetota bacterium]
MSENTPGSRQASGVKTRPLPVASQPSSDRGDVNIARIYDCLLGGKDNYAADRAAAEAVRARRPNIANQALDNKKFQTRAVSHAAGQGVR